MVSFYSLNYGTIKNVSAIKENHFQFQNSPHSPIIMCFFYELMNLFIWNYKLFVYNTLLSRTFLYSTSLVYNFSEHMKYKS